MKSAIRRAATRSRRVTRVVAHLLVLLAAGCSEGGAGFYPALEDDGGESGEGGASRDGGVDALFDLARRSDLARPPSPDLAVNDGWPPAWSALEEAVLVITNQRRAAGATCGAKTFGPAGPLTMHAALRKSARLHSQDMATQNYFNHTSLDGRSPFDRMRSAGFAGGTMGENIAAGNGTAAATMGQWMNSPGHCENIMNPMYRYLGVGYAYNAKSQYGHVWTQNFGG